MSNRDKKEIKEEIIKKVDKWEQDKNEDDWELLDGIITLLLDKNLEEVLSNGQ